MGVQFSETNRKKFFLILGLDAVALLIALYHQFRTVRAGRITIRNNRTKQAAWMFAALMGLITVGFIFVAREKEEGEKEHIIRGLPPKDN